MVSSANYEEGFLSLREIFKGNFDIGTEKRIRHFEINHIGKI